MSAPKSVQAAERKLLQLLLICNFQLMSNYRRQMLQRVLMILTINDHFAFFNFSMPVEQSGNIGWFQQLFGFFRVRNAL
jgi:hypothetical protein